MIKEAYLDQPGIDRDSMGTGNLQLFESEVAGIDEIVAFDGPEDTGDLVNRGKFLSQPPVADCL